MIPPPVHRIRENDFQFSLTLAKELKFNLASLFKIKIKINHAVTDFAPDNICFFC